MVYLKTHLLHNYLLLKKHFYHSNCKKYFGLKNYFILGDHLRAKGNQKHPLPTGKGLIPVCLLVITKKGEVLIMEWFTVGW